MHKLSIDVSPNWHITARPEPPKTAELFSPKQEAPSLQFRFYSPRVKRAVVIVIDIYPQCFQRFAAGQTKGRKPKPVGWKITHLRCFRIWIFSSSSLGLTLLCAKRWSLATMAQSANRTSDCHPGRSLQIQLHFASNPKLLMLFVLAFGKFEELVRLWRVSTKHRKNPFELAVLLCNAKGLTIKGDCGVGQKSVKRRSAQWEKRPLWADGAKQQGARRAVGWFLAASSLSRQCSKGFRSKQRLHKEAFQPRSLNWEQRSLTIFTSLFLRCGKGRQTDCVFLSICPACSGRSLRLLKFFKTNEWCFRVQLVIQWWMRRHPEFRLVGSSSQVLFTDDGLLRNFFLFRWFCFFIFRNLVSKWLQTSCGS